MNYSDLLKDPEWQKLRLKILNLHDFTCQLCDNKKTELHVHHRVYIKGKKPWEYSDDNFCTYCKYCHKIVEGVKQTGFSVMKVERIYYKNSPDIMFIALCKNRKELNISVFETRKGELNLKMLILPEDLYKMNNLISLFKPQLHNG